MSPHLARRRERGPCEHIDDRISGKVRQIESQSFASTYQENMMMCPFTWFHSTRVNKLLYLGECSSHDEERDYETTVSSSSAPQRSRGVYPDDISHCFPISLLKAPVTILPPLLVARIENWIDPQIQRRKERLCQDEKVALEYCRMRMVGKVWKGRERESW